MPARRQSSTSLADEISALLDTRPSTEVDEELYDDGDDDGRELLAPQDRAGASTSKRRLRGRRSTSARTVPSMRGV